MPSLYPTVVGTFAAASFDADAAAPAFRFQRGFANPGFVRSALGVYTFTLLDGVNLATEAVVKAGVNQNASGMIAVEVISTTSFAVRTFTGANAAADIDFWVEVNKYIP